MAMAAMPWSAFVARIPGARPVDATGSRRRFPAGGFRIGQSMHRGVIGDSAGRSHASPGQP
jgi:hypothetical protein